MNSVSEFPPFTELLVLVDEPYATTISLRNTSDYVLQIHNGALRYRL